MYLFPVHYFTIVYISFYIKFVLNREKFSGENTYIVLLTHVILTFIIHSITKICFFKKLSLQYIIKYPSNFFQSQREN